MNIGAIELTLKGQLTREGKPGDALMYASPNKGWMLLVKPENLHAATDGDIPEKIEIRIWVDPKEAES